MATAKETALKLVKYSISRACFSPEHHDKALAALALLSSPCDICGGEEPVDEFGAEVYDVRGGTARASGHAKVYGKDLKEGQVLHCLAFLPPEKAT